MIGARDYSWFYLRCPRTASRSLTEVIMNAWPGDHCGMRSQRSIPESVPTAHSRAWYFTAHKPVAIPPESFTFTFIRGPYDWVRSWWALRMIHDEGYWGKWPQDQVKQRHEKPTLPQYVEWVLDEWPGMCGDIFSLYTQAAHFVGTTEHLLTDFWVVCDYLGKPKPVDLPIVGQGHLAEYSVPSDLLKRFVASEEVAYDLWEKAMNL